MKKAKTTHAKPLAVDSVEIRLSDGQSIELAARNVDDFCTTGFRRIQAAKLGLPMPRGRFTREWVLLEEAAMNKRNRPLLEIALAVVQNDAL